MTDARAEKANKRREIIVKTLLFGGVVALPLLIGVVNLVAFMMVAAQNPDDRVADDFYKKALAVHKNAEPNKLAIERGISASLSYFGNDGVVEVQLFGEHQAPSVLALDLIHGVDASQDTRILLSATAEGNFVGQYQGELHRFSEMRLQPVSVEQTWLLVKPTVALNRRDIAGAILWKVTL